MDLVLTQPLAPVAVDDREARFEQFVAAHRVRAVRLAFRLSGGGEAVAEDVAQEAFLRAHRGLSRFREEAQLSTWFYRILVREASNHRRRAALRRRLSTLLGFDDKGTPAATDPLLREVIERALDRLSESQRAVFILVHVEQMTVVEAASMMGCALGTAKSHLHRALQKLRTELSEHRS